MSDDDGHPYLDIPETAFWSSAVAKRNFLEISDLWNPKFPIKSSMKISTFGSCFAQHIGRALREHGFRWFEAEEAPERMAADTKSLFNYGVFSARTGNIYTTSLLKQWLEWACEKNEVPTEVWHKDGRYYDPFRPTIEPDGFASKDELQASRQLTLKALRTAAESSSVFVFTLGLTESWKNRVHGYEYPVCPGTAAGEFSAEQHEFVNQDFVEIRKALLDSVRLLQSVNPKVRIILTVSPVPLTATMSGNHVLLATMESKSILRAVAGNVARSSERIDYFPSYEIINSPVMRGAFFEPNQRSVSSAGVRHVMNEFFRCLFKAYPELSAKQATAEHRGKNASATVARKKGKALASSDPTSGDIVCDEELLDAFSPERDSR